MSSSLLVGSIANWSSQTVTIDGGGGATAYEVAASKTGMYVTHPTDSTLSAMDLLLARMTTEGIVSASVVLLQNGKVRVSGSGTFSITWTDTTLRDFLGFDADLSGSNAYTAANTSPYIWRPGTTEHKVSGYLGGEGVPHHDVHQGETPSGIVYANENGSPLTHDSIEWRKIPVARYRTSAATNLELGTFFTKVLVKRARFLHYRAIEDDDSSSTVLTLPTPSGPYQPRGKMTHLQTRRSSGFEFVDAYHDHSIKLLKTPEYS